MKPPLHEIFRRNFFFLFSNIVQKTKTKNNHLQQGTKNLYQVIKNNNV